MARFDQKPPEFFIDRSLGRYLIADGLRAIGWNVRTMASVYGEAHAQRIADAEWLRDAGENDWVVLMKDDKIRRRSAEIGALAIAKVRAFCLTQGALKGEEQLARFIRNQHRIVRLARRPGPYIYGVYENQVRLLWPTT